MTGVRQRHGTAAALLLIAALLFSIPGSLSGQLRTAPAAPGGNDYIEHASVIKTQRAADSLLSQGCIRGIDVSKYQGAIDWTRVAGSDVNFAFIRATYGTTNDPYFLTNAQQAHENGLYVGAYHYATFKNRDEMQTEAAHFLSRLKKVNITYPVVLDLESATHKAMKRSTLTSLAVEFMDILRAEGYNVMLYSYNNFIRDHLDVGKLSGYDLWIANYLEQPSAASHKVWQHTASGSVSGIKGPVDINIAYEDMSGGGSRKVKVSKTVSNAIKETLNNRYGVGLPIDGLNLERMYEAIAVGLQYEIGSQWGVDLPVTGSLSAEEMDYLNSVSWDSSTGGNITYLIQARLFYAGHYKGDLTGMYDSNTVDAVRSFQRANNLGDYGDMDYDTLCALFLS